MFRRLGVACAVATLAVFAAAGTARADNGNWCGQDEGTCDTSMTYMQCSDGTDWAFDPAYFDAETYGDVFCDGDYSILAPPPVDGGEVAAAVATQADVGLGADPNMAPDPTQYGTEIRCPDGGIWAVPIGTSFVCPAA